MGAHARFSSTGRWLRVAKQLMTIAFLAVVAGWHLTVSATTRLEARPQTFVRLPGHVLDGLQGAKPLTPAAGAARAPITLTVTLKRTDQAGFERYLHDVYDPHSPLFRHFLTQPEITSRFGPSQRAYDRVLAHLKRSGFALTEGSENRLTLTVRGTRRQAERAFGLGIRDYDVGTRSFYANDRDPLLPVSVGREIHAIAGLTNAGAPAAPLGMATPEEDNFCNLLTNLELGAAGLNLGLPLLMGLEVDFMLVAYDSLLFISPIALGPITAVGFPLALVNMYCAGLTLGGASQGFQFKAMAARAANNARLSFHTSPLTRVMPKAANNQKIGLLEFDTFRASDIQDWLDLTHADASFASRLSQVAVNGGVSSPGAGQSEVLLDIVTVMLLDRSPSTKYVVYHAPANTTWQQMFNAMINDGVTVISNSWSDCEDQHTLADVQSIDAVLAAAAASGVSVFNGSGDSGAKCLDGTPNTVGVPASSPHATAVGGTTPKPTLGYTYAGETWWDGSAKLPPTGMGGFGVSRYFARPVYQNGLTASPMRSVPDVALNADPRTGLGLCQADAGGCPDGLMHGGTSMSSPQMAVMMANLNESLGTNVGEVNPVIYPLANTNAFHSPASMGSDFAHVGLGSPRLSYLHLLLSQQTIGPVNASRSSVASTRVAVADGVTPAVVQVNLLDANGYPVSGKNITLVPSAGSHVAISSASGASDVDSGAVLFGITDSTVENVTFTATDVTDGVTLSETTTIQFLAPPATAASITALPNSVAANGTSATTITVTLQDANAKPSPGKTVGLSQGAGHSVLTAPSPAVTDASGQIQFTATDTVAETVTYTAVDVTDGNLPVPGSASVTFTGGSVSCLPAPPTAAPGFTLTPFANGFVAQNFFFGNINFVGCPGVSNPAFDASGSMLVADFPTGDLYKLPATGGAASTANKLSNLGKTFGNLVFGKDGSLYGSIFSPAAVVQVDPATGAVVRVVASGFSCASGLAIDPLSGDLFFDDNCVGGIQNASIWRVQNPSNANPTVVVYSTLPGFGNGALAFAPDGTLFAVCCAFSNATAPVLMISGTNQPAPHNAVPINGITADTGGLAIGEVLPNGAAKSLIVHTGGAAGGVGGSLKLIDLTTLSATVLANGLAEPGVIGPDGCMYVNSHDTILRLAPLAGPCSFAPTNPAPALALSPSTFAPNPAQGATATFTASLANVSQPQGTPITFLVGGANSKVKMVRADANGQATFTYSGVYTGTDHVVATATLNSQPINSNPAQVTWTAGRHATFTTLNLSPTAGAVGRPVTVTASVTDISSQPAAPVSNANVTLTLADSACAAVTDANGLASCTVIPTATGLLNLSAAFPGTANYAGSTTSAAFTARGALVSALKCDANADGKVDAADLAIIRRSIGATAGPDDPRDTNGDGVINIVDYRYCVLHQTAP